ncbi:MAG: cytochrome c [Gammaproteobacteria bacterium]|nr:cytochrome c [Gammaproteobacteria bacterium]
MKKTLVSASLLILCSQTALATEVDAEAYIKYRENLMTSAKIHSGGIGDILKGKLPLQANLQAHARALHESISLFASAFPEGSDFGETAAKANVWSDAAGFAAAADKSTAAAAALVKASETGDLQAIGAAMADVGKSCKGCHDEYRAKK